MFSKFLLPVLLALPATALADRIIPPANLFQDPSFIKEFVGSYGFLSDVEPKVSADEQAALTTIRDLFEKSQFAQAEQEIIRFIKETENPTDPKKQPAEISPAMIFVLGNLYFQADRTDEARRAFLEAIKRFPRFRRAHTNLAFLYISKNQTDEALPLLQKSIELGETTARVYGMLGFCHLVKKNAVAAENAYRQAYLLDANSRDWKLGLSQSMLAQDKFAEAASLLGSIIEENPNDKQLWLQQTNAFLGMDRKEDAAINLEILRFKGLADEANLNLLGNLYMDRSEPQLALFAYMAAIDKATALDVPRALKSAKILTDYGFPDKASTFVQKIRTKLGANIPAGQKTMLMLTEVRIAQAEKKPEIVEKLLNELTQIDPTNGEVLLELAKHFDLLAKEESDETKRGALIQNARTNYQLAVRTPLVAYQANLGLGQMYVREKRYVEAMPLLETALTLKKSESLDQYTSRVRRAADRQRQKDESKETTKP
jgi:tetratricopeptide (TPR) repeat protein